MTEIKTTKTIVGLTEEVIITGPTGVNKKVVARIDTGATKSSIDLKLANELKIKHVHVLEKKIIRSASGTKERDIVKAKIKIAGRIFKSKFSIADRAHMKYKVLVGQNTLKRNFLIDPNKK